MIIVYLSVALMAVSLIYLGYTAIKAIKAAKPAIDDLSETAARLQRKVDTVKVETNKLSENQQEIKADIEYKKSAFQLTIDNAKQTPEFIKKLWKIRPLARIERKSKFKRFKRGSSLHSQY